MKRKYGFLLMLILIPLFTFGQTKVFDNLALEFSLGKQYCFKCGVSDIPRHIVLPRNTFIFPTRPIGNYWNIKLQIKNPWGYVVFLFQKTSNYSYYTEQIADNVYITHFPFYSRYEYYGLLYKVKLFSDRFRVWVGPVYMAFYQEMMGRTMNPFVLEWEIWERSPHSAGMEDLGMNLGMSYRLMKFRGWDLLAEAGYFYNISSTLSETLSLGLSAHLRFEKAKP